MPAWLLGVAIVVAAVGLSAVAVWAVRRRVPIETLQERQEVTSYILAVVAVVYAVLLAFVVVIVWQGFEDASADATREAAAVGLVYRDALALGDRGAGVRAALQDYASSVVKHEWPRMADEHDEARETDTALNAVWDSYRGLATHTGHEEVFYAEGLRRLNDAVELRRARILTSSSQLPLPLWIVLIVGALIVIGFAAFFAVARYRVHLALIAGLASTIALVLFLILSLDLPFTGDIGVTPSAMDDAAHEFAHSAP